MSNSIILHNSSEYTSNKVSTKSTLRACGRGYTPTRRVGKILTNILIALSIVAPLSIISAQPAQANWLGDAIEEYFCGEEAYGQQPETYTTGMTATGFGAHYIAKKIEEQVMIAGGGDPNWAAQPHTAYERYGMSGMKFTVYRGGETVDDLNTNSSQPTITDDDGDKRIGEGVPCQPVERRGDSKAANAMLNVTKTMTAVSSGIYIAALEGEVLDSMTESVGKMITGGDGFKGLRDALYIEFLGFVIMISALWLAWVGLIKRSSIEAGQSALWMIGAVIVGSLIMFNPVSTLRETNNIVNVITAGALTGVTGLSSDATTAEDDMCALPSARGGGSGSVRAIEQTESANLTNEERVSATIECSLWRAFVYTPWAIGQWGSASQDFGNDQVPEAVDLGAGRSVRSWQLYQIEQQSLDVESMAGDTSVAIEQKKNDWFHIRDHVAEEQPQVWSTWIGEQGDQRQQIAGFSVIVAACGLIMIVVMSIFMLIYEIGSILLMSISALALLFGVHPGIGRRIAMRWAEMFLFTILARITMSLLLAVLIGFYQVAFAMATVNYATMFIMVLAISFGGLYWRKKIVAQFSSVSLGGIRTQIQERRALKAALPTLLGAGVAVAAGAPAAAVAAKTSGGAAAVRTMAKAGVTGAQRGAASRNTVSNVMNSASAGRYAAHKEAARRNATQQKAEEKKNEEKAKNQEE